MDSYLAMKEAAEKALKSIPAGASQVLVTKTESGAISVFANDLSAAAEERFLASQEEALSAILCVWANGQIDVPSIRLRKTLIESNPKNADAVIYLQGEEICKKLLSQTV